MKLIYLFAAFAIGMTFALQPAINGAAARVLGSPVSAAVISVAITLIACIFLMPIFGARLSLGDIANLPWWVIFGGIIGAGVVAGGAAIAPATGAALFFVCLIAGQLVGSAIVDSTGAFGMQLQSLSYTKLAGIGLALGGVVLVRYG
ncbi:MAG: DMT family transporter [Pseudomonadota bacterium]